MDAIGPLTAVYTTKRSTANSTFAYSYPIPDEIREAARIVAESAPQARPAGNHEEVAARMRRKYLCTALE